MNFQNDIAIKEFKLSEIFYSIQGEGENVGTSMIFVRFSGCNLTCPFCDTDHSLKDVFNVDKLVFKTMDMVRKTGCRNVLFTGGEPTLQLFTNIGESLVKKLYSLGYKLYLETNGTLVDGYEMLHYFTWITVSPKTDRISLQSYNEIKLVISPDTINLFHTYTPVEVVKYLQPNDNKNISHVVSLVKRFPDNWKLSLQIQKLIGEK